MTVVSMCTCTLLGVGLSSRVAGWRRWVVLCATGAVLAGGVADLAGVLLAGFLVVFALNAEWVVRTLRATGRKDAGWVDNVLAVLGLARSGPRS